MDSSLKMFRNWRRFSIKYRSQYGRLSLLEGLLMIGLLASGWLVDRLQIQHACAGWPLCAGEFSYFSWSDWLHMGHRSMVFFVGILLTLMLIQSWQKQRSQPFILVASSAVWVLFLAQALLGVQLVNGFPGYLVVIHQVTAISTWIILSMKIVAVGLAGRTEAEEVLEKEESRTRVRFGRDLLMLTKPIVVALLLVTTFAGMVIGAQEWPRFWLIFWTLVGGFMAAGGSGAINQYIDRYDDLKMQRTQKRPIPSGRMTPAEGLAFGVGMTLASFYVMVAFVNLTAALLTLAGIVYYVVLYSILLKKTTVQNIVIGGGAGAIPPLVGWAAATGSLNVPALFLFAVVFMWTPPHFWALALVRKNDYARAGVPMLPVVRGEAETRKQVLVYTIELVVLTLLLPVFGLGGSVYFIGAGILGLWLTHTAWKVWKSGGNKLAWKMYRYSSMYLAFYFIVLMIDRLIQKG